MNLLDTFFIKIAETFTNMYLFYTHSPPILESAK